MSPSATDQESSDRFGDYELFEEVGRGGMGVVYRARQISLNRIVAVKRLASNAASLPFLAQRLRIEAEAAAGLTHPHIVSIYEVGEHQNLPFFSMELIDGVGLNRCISPSGFKNEKISLAPDARRRGSQAKTATLVMKIAHAVHYAHSHGVLHRDLKPANVVLDADGEPHLTDFGLAKILGRGQTLISDEHTVKGTVAFMAPEQARGKIKQISTAADVYGLGAILYNLLTGKAPFRAENPLETLRQVVEDEPIHPAALNRAVDRDLAIICLKCLAKEPSHRYPSAQALAGDLKRWLHCEPIEARPLGPFGRLCRFCQREPKTAALIIGLFFFITVTAALALVLLQKEESRHRVASEEAERSKTRLMDRIARDRTRGNSEIEISAEDLAILAGHTMPLPKEGEKRLSLGSSAPPRIPDHLVMPFYYFTANLRTSLWEIAQIPIEFDLRLYVSDAAILESVLQGQADLVQVDPAVYVRARQESSKIVQPLVREIHRGDPGVRGFIVTSFQSGITNLMGLKGRSFVFGPRNSALGWSLPRKELAKAGLRAGDFLQQTNVASPGALSLVRTGAFDAGAVLEEDLEMLELSGKRMRVLAPPLSAPDSVWVLTGDWEPLMVNELRKAFIRLRDETILGRFDYRLLGFGPAMSSDYDDLERDMDEAGRFEEP